jgi:hypothetical protein
MKNPSDTIGIRTHDLPACSAVSQPTAPQSAPTLRSNFANDIGGDGKIDRGLYELYFAKDLGWKEGEIWLEPALNMHTPLSLHTHPVSFVRSSSSL